MIKFQEVNQTFFGFHGLSDHFVDETKVKSISFSMNQPTRLSLTVRRDSDYLPVSRLGDARAVIAVYDNKLLQSILDTGEWACREDGHGNTTYMRLPPEAKKEPVKPIWTALLEWRHMNSGLPAHKEADWSDVSNRIERPVSSTNNLRTYVNNRKCL